MVSATLWLAITGQLALYIHPRYVVFTVVMASIAALFVMGALVRASLSRDEHKHHDHAAPQDQKIAQPGWRQGARLGATGVSAIVVAAAVLALLLVPPTTLTSGTAAMREMNSGTAAVADDFVSIGADYKTFTVKDWSSLLAQVSTESFYSGKSVDVVGFISPDDTDPHNVFYVSRFIVTCCAVDAQPVGVPVYKPGWADELAADTWVHVTGPFMVGAGDGPPVLVDPEVLEVVDRPADPYVH